MSLCAIGVLWRHLGVTLCVLAAFGLGLYAGGSLREGRRR